MTKKITIEILSSGSYTSVQCAKRYDHVQHGVPMGGPCDRYSAAIGRWIANESKVASIECTGVGPRIRIHGNCQLTLTGAHTEATLNDNILLPFYKLLNIKDGSIINLPKIIKGYRTYVTINGIILNPNYKLISPRLVKDQRIEIETKSNHLGRLIPKELLPTYSKSITLRYQLGPEVGQFLLSEIKELSDRKFTVSRHSNRMGIKLSEKLTTCNPQSEMISSGVVPGTIQLTHDNSLIILLNDAQTTGGYPRIGNIISADMDKLGQAAPGMTISLEKVDLDEAQSALSLYKENLSYFIR